MMQGKEGGREKDGDGKRKGERKRVTVAQKNEFSSMGGRMKYTEEKKEQNEKKENE